MMVTCHSNRLLSSTRPAEKPSTGLRMSSAGQGDRVGRGHGTTKCADSAPLSCFRSSSAPCDSAINLLAAWLERGLAVQAC